ncbi:head GIN domain-containing protein [uncultured Arcticibacterium sp.]|uniref:head GIN domain-containing protein n=1 Tax=uncultured Arcticibacterium sp. TaxID=2173042 RepID=UPI0030FCB098
MKKIKLFTLLTALVVFSKACVSIDFDGVSPDNETEVYDLGSFTELDLGSAFEVVVVPSSEFKVTATGSSTNLNDLNVRVVNNTLKVSYYNRNIFRPVSRNKMELLIEMPELKEADISGAATVYIEDFDYFSTLKLDLGGASKVTLDVEVGDLDVDISGASTVTLKRGVPVLSADLSGASKLNAYDADSEEAYLKLSGASKANVSVAEYLKVDASGASTVNYRGLPRIDQDLSGASKVKKN